MVGLFSEEYEMDLACFLCVCFLFYSYSAVMSNLKTEMTSEFRPHSWQGPRRVLYIVFTPKTKNSFGPLVVVGSQCYVAWFLSV
jgi:hypothetical protein